ncbi:RHS repeat-associated core domain-containing protein [Vibrio navarrensis]|uniref:RHS repeat-associated core domain-containing protein n=1 Tax=Vibrio navarrensis TaxID=29495 RepID=UPI001EE3B7B4|nr:RHS repeat-associated core domain-containing protein [Vibrio navarrensis]MBE3669492.1 RHS repeat-associated core domain-containing protein [Vibrio navarrensis]
MTNPKYNAMNSNRFYPSRRRFLKQASGISTLAISGITLPPIAFANPTQPFAVITANPMSFNAERQDPITGNYYLGKGTRMYNPRLMRFHSYDSMSPFGKGGTNGYAYCLGDPINQRDPSGHFALLSILIGAIIGAIVGAAASAAVEGIQCAINPEHKFDWKQVVIGAAVGFVTGGIGVAASAPTTAAQLGLTIAKAAAAELASVPINTVTALSMQPNASKGLQIAGQVLGFSLAIFGVGYGVKGAASLGKSIAKGRVAISSSAKAYRRIGRGGADIDKAMTFKNFGVTDPSKYLSIREAVFTGISIATGISSATAGIAFNTMNHLGKSSRNSEIAMRFFHFTSSVTGAFGSRYLNPIKNLKSDPVGYLSGRFTDLSHVTGLVAMLFTEPGSDENRQWNTVSFLCGTTSLYTLNVQNHLKHFDKKMEKKSIWRQVDEEIYNTYY